MSIYKIDQKNRYNKLLKTILPLIPDFSRNYLETQVNRLESSTRYGYATNYLYFFTFIIENIPRFNSSNPALFTIDDLKNISYKDIDYFKEFYLKDHSDYALRRVLSSLSSLLNFYIKAHILEINPVIAVKRPIISLSDKQALSDNDIDTILSNVRNNQLFNGKSATHHKRLWKRDYAIFILISKLGFRVSDICGLNISHIDFSSNSIWTLNNYSGWDIIHFTDDIKSVLFEYLNCRNGWKIQDEDAFFIQRDGKRLSSKSVDLIVKKYASFSPELGNITPRLLRSSCLNSVS